MEMQGGKGGRGDGVRVAVRWISLIAGAVGHWGVLVLKLELALFYIDLKNPETDPNIDKELGDGEVEALSHYLMPVGKTPLGIGR